MKDTKSDILCIANELIRSVGYNAFSYTDISKPLNIKNAAVHYYFPAKADLGVEVIKQNMSLFKEKIEMWRNLGCRQQYTMYITMHNEFIANNLSCIVGSLSPAFNTLPERMQKELQKLITAILDWLTHVLEEGRSRKEFVFEGNPRTKANVIHSALLSSLLMNKVLKNDIYQSIQDSLLSI